MQYKICNSITKYYIICSADAEAPLRSGISGMRFAKKLKPVFALVLACVLSVQMVPVSANAGGNRTAEPDGSMLDANQSQIDSYSDRMSYSSYLEKYKDTAKPKARYDMDAASFTSVKDMQTTECENYEGMQGTSILTQESGSIGWTVNVAETGLYDISILYYPVAGKSSDIQRSVFLDGNLPFTEAADVEFRRIWANESDTIQKDNQGNEMKPKQVEKPSWEETRLEDADGFYTKPFLFYLTAGKHTVEFVSQKEPMVIRRISICSEETVPTYKEASEEYSQRGYRKAMGQDVVLQAEKAARKSSPTLYPITDRSSPTVEPNGVGKIKLNSIGGYNWRYAGQWIEWQINVPQTGLYEIGMNVQQNWMRGLYVPRELSIDGKVPFEEMEEVKFEYGSGWRQQVLGGDSPFLFYLTAGKHTLRMTAVLGKASEYIRNVEQSIKNLNKIYQKIVMLTGQQPDRWRDYQIAQNIPGLADELKVEYERLEKTAEGIRGLVGQNSDKEAMLLTMTQQLKLFYEDVDKIPAREDSFKTNIGSLGTWLTEVQEMPLQIDAIYLIPPENQPPKTNDSLWSKIAFQVRLLFDSFVNNYNAIGNVSTDKNARSITVWVGSGRDQANTMKSLIDESFTKETGINVNLMLVQMDSLLQATLAGQGPDVAMQVTNDVPMNYALRGAVVNLSQFGDYSSVASRFRPSALVPFRFRGKCYALPETQTFNMMFYRKDILKELGMPVPRTWNDVKADMSVLAKNNMEFGMVPIPPIQQGTMAPSQTDLTYGMFLYQFGGQFYNGDGRSSALDSDTAVSAFKEWTGYYSDYSLTQVFDPQNRFRTGEDPIVIADYSLYNTLQVSAPEIKGLWGFTQVPGTQKADGSVDHSVPSTGTSTIILQKAKDKEAAWEFLKWWTSSEIQTKYGLEMEALQGPSARYPTANIKALESLPWPTSDFKSLTEAFKSVKGIPQVPGGYYTARDLTNAFATVVIDKKIGPREALMDNVRYIDDEITNKRKEFHLDSQEMSR